MIIIYLYIYLEPNVTQLTSIFEGQPSKTRPCSIKTRVIWVLAKYEYIYIYICTQVYTLDLPPIQEEFKVKVYRVPLLKMGGGWT